jgi:hypothetical protein
MLRAAAVGWRVAACWAGRAEPQGGLIMTLTYGFRSDPYNKRFLIPPVFGPTPYVR